MVVQTDVSEDGVSVPAGIYFVHGLTGANASVRVSSLRVEGYNFNAIREVLKAKYLPANVGTGSSLPKVNENSNGKTLVVSDGKWKIDNLIPPASAENEGAFLRVVDGVWTAVILPDAEEEVF
jgi:hypothetical protein